MVEVGVTRFRCDQDIINNGLFLLFRYYLELLIIPSLGFVYLGQQLGFSALKVNIVAYLLFTFLLFEPFIHATHVVYLLCSLPSHFGAC